MLREDLISRPHVGLALGSAPTQTPSHQPQRPHGKGNAAGSQVFVSVFQTAAVTDPTNLKNAKNAILEELPRIVNTMALLWNVLRKEETQKRPVDLLGATKGSSSVYFKTTKVRELPLQAYDFLCLVLSCQK